MEEFFDILDEKGRIIGKMPRSVVHSKGLIHRSVYFFIFDKDYRVLVNQRSDTKEFLPEYWAITLGGHLSSGETYEQAVAREIPEETGIKSKPFYITDYRNFWIPNDRELAKVYGVISDGSLKLDKTEIKQAFFLPLNEAKKLLSAKNILPETWDMIRILENFLQSNPTSEGRHSV